MEDLGNKPPASAEVENTHSEDETINEVIRVVKTKLSQRQKKDLGLVKPKEEYKRPRTPAQLAHDERLRTINKEKAEILRKEKAEYEEERLKKFHLEAEQKQKRKNNVKNITDDEEYQKFLEFKKISSEAPARKVREHGSPRTSRRVGAQPQSDESSDDGYIQKKTKKTQKLIQQVEEFENKVNKMQIPSNPYLELFQKKRT